MLKSQIYSLTLTLNSIHLQELNQKLQIKQQNMIADSIEQIYTDLPYYMRKKCKNNIKYM